MSDKDIILASEKVNRGNILACIDYSNATRKLVLEWTEIIKNMQNTIKQIQAENVEMKKQMTYILTKIYSGGTT